MPTLDWLNRNAAFRIADQVPYRLIEPVSSHGSGDPQNLLVQGDNLDALKALLPLYRAQVKCIFIDPPYNTKSAFEHYDDNLEHSQWLSMMLPRLQLLREFLREDGSIWVTIDDNEGHYLKVLMDEVFGRANFIATIAWEKDKGGRGDADISTSQDMVLSFAINRRRWSETRNLLVRSDTQAGRFQNPDGDPRGPWRQGDDGTAKSGSEKQRFLIELPSGRKVVPKQGRYWAFSPETFERARTEGRVYFGKDGDRLPVIKRYLTEVREGVAPRTWWPAEDAGTNQAAKRDHLSKLLPEIEPFATPKPEQLLQRILHICSNPNDLVLDSFLGSGTTAAVAHKMGRRRIGIEMGDHAVSHCLPRLEKVLAGEQGGISPAVGWQGGGGFRFGRLSEPVFSADGRINPQVRFASLAAFVWQQETRQAYVSPLPGAVPGTPLLGVHDGLAVYLLYNGILGDRRPEGGNLLTLTVLQALKAACPHAGPKVVYGEACRLGSARLEAEGLVFRQIPYDLAAK
ncbi:site-specific DNA-methyltransferase [Aquabacterium sp.]|uniref:site-specific DNA-methyltransferase n=1 Tax=Aquabacterium sp. TaxID=1872578 RepID=UPI002C1E9BD9|nr:site-specific DNA-methyltransferase [Aquabacterium sp.]HSW05459.1 site-specific DNA-methyltransferase [Aquabacterium sp.]